MPISEIMTRKVITVGMDTEVKQIDAYFRDIQIHHLVVVDEGIVRGVISDRDVYRCISPFVGTPAEMERDTYTLTKKAHQIMTREVITVDETSSIKKAAAIILDNNIGCLPVVDDQRKLVGIVTWRDVFRYAVTK